MQIIEILNTKQGSAPDKVISCEQSDQVRDALKLMIDNNIGALPVVSEEKVVGVYSERDVVRSCQQQGVDFLGYNLSDMMSANVITVRPDQSVDDALVLMRDNNIRHLPVIDNNKMVGFLSLRDLMNAKLDYANKTAEFLKDQVHIMDKPLPM